MHEGEDIELRPVTDLGPTGWLAARLRPFTDHVVTSLVPVGFPAYLRVFHPVQGVPASADREVSWQQVASWSGRRLHPLAQWPALSTPIRRPRGQPPWDGQPPRHGQLSNRQLRWLAPVLAAATTTPQRCWFCLWDGFGFLYRSSVTSIVVARAGTDQPSPLVAAGQDVSGLPRLRLPGRDLLVFTGPVAAVDHVGTGLGPYPHDVREGPNLWWPDDHAWVVASDIDLTSTYLACDRNLADEILSSTAVEALACRPDDAITYDSDTINRDA